MPPSVDSLTIDSNNPMWNSADELVQRALYLKDNFGARRESFGDYALAKHRLLRESKLPIAIKSVGNLTTADKKRIRIDNQISCEVDLVPVNGGQHIVPEIGIRQYLFVYDDDHRENNMIYEEPLSILNPLNNCGTDLLRVLRK